MLNDAPKKKKDYAHPTKPQLFWRVQGECWRRAVTPFLMYLFMGMIGLLCTMAKLPWLVIILVSLCIAGGAAFNAHLAYNCGKLHYDAYATGELHRSNERIGIPSGGDHHVEREYRFWKGGAIGLCVAAPVILLSLIGTFADHRTLGFFFIMIAAWSYLPVWFAGGGLAGEGSYLVNPVWCLLMAILPIVVTAVFYCAGAMAEKRKKEAQAAREAEVERLREEQKREAEERAKKAEEARKARIEARALEERQTAKNKSKKKKK